MIVSRSISLALAVACVAGTAPARALAQDQPPVLRALQVAGRSARIGATVSELPADDAKQQKSGVLVDTITPGGPADKAGIKSGDTISEFDGERVRSVAQFSRVVRESTPDRGVPVVLSRGGQRLTVTVAPESRSWSDDFSMRLLDLPRAAVAPRPPTPPAVPRAARPPMPFDSDALSDMPRVMRLWNTRGIGLTIESIDDQLAQYFGVKEGVLVKSVLVDSASQKAGLKAGDVITAINGTKIYDASDVNRAIDRVGENGEFTVEVVRDKKTQSLKGKIDEGQARRRVRVPTEL